jgi:hypothetical protein
MCCLLWQTRIASLRGARQFGADDASAENRSHHLLWKTRIAAPAARAISAPMMRLGKFEVNNWSDQLTPDFGSPILGWSDQIAV